MYTDSAIQYNATLLEIEDNIKQLNKIQINSENYELAIEKIKETVKQEVRNCYINYNKTETNFLLQDSLIAIYQKAIKQLDKINMQITQEYEFYYKICAQCKHLNTKIENLENHNIEQLIKETLELLKNTKNSTVIDYNSEKDIVESVYELAYKMLKLELIYTNNTSLLDYIKHDVTDISYISRLIKTDINALNKEKNESLKNKLQEIDKKGFEDIHYIDKDLIVLICLLNNDSLTYQITN